VKQFLASRNIDGTFKQTAWRFRQGNFCHRVIGAADVAGRMIMCCTPTVRLLIALNLPAVAVLSQPATGLSALAPAQRAGGVLGMLSSLEVKVFCPT